MKQINFLGLPPVWFWYSWWFLSRLHCDWHVLSYTDLAPVFINKHYQLFSCRTMIQDLVWAGCGVAFPALTMTSLMPKLYKFVWLCCHDDVVSATLDIASVAETLQWLNNILVPNNSTQCYVNVAISHNNEKLIRSSLWLVYESRFVKLKHWFERRDRRFYYSVTWLVIIIEVRG